MKQAYVFQHLVDSSSKSFWQDSYDSKYCFVGTAEAAKPQRGQGDSPKESNVGFRSLPLWFTKQVTGQKMAHGHSVARLLFPSCLFPPGCPVGVGASKRQPCGLFETLQCLTHLCGAQRNLCTAGLRIPKDLLWLLLRGMSWCFFFFFPKLCQGPFPVPSLSLINKGEASCYMPGCWTWTKCPLWLPVFLCLH